MDIKYYTTSANLLLWQDHYEKGEKKDFIQCERSFIPVALILFSYQIHGVSYGAIKLCTEISLKDKFNLIEREAYLDI